MNTIRILTACLSLWLMAMLIGASAPAATTRPAPESAKGEFINPDWKAAGLHRSGMVWVPSDQSKRPKNGWPCVFVFHGHGGSDRNAMRSFAIEKSWPDAVVVYLKGLPTKGVLTDPEGNRAGWDMRTKPEDNRDIALFDVVLNWLIKEQKIDPSRVYVTGHSNGGGFTYSLWAYRGDKIAAIAPSAAALSFFAGRDSLMPKPVMIMAAGNDPLVQYKWQESMIALAKKLNQCGKDGKPWAPGGKEATWFDSPTGNPVVTLIHDRGHAMPQDVGTRVADFFKALTPAK